MACIASYFLFASFVVQVALCCTETLYSLDVIETCDNFEDTSVTQQINIYSNTTIGQKIDICDISTSITFDAFRILLAGDIFIEKTLTERAALISTHLYSFYVYDFDEWEAAQCDTNIYDASCASSITPLTTYGPSLLRLSAHGLDSRPYMSLSFDYPGITISASSSLIWLFHIQYGFTPNIASNAYFITCDISDNNLNNAQYHIYPEQYNAISINNTAVIYTLSEECSTTDDNTLTELLPADCNSKQTGARFTTNGQSYSQYFAVNTATTESIAGMTLYFELSPGPSSDTSSCEWIADLALYSPHEEEAFTASATISDLSQSHLTAFDFVFDEILNIDNSELFLYFYFTITISSGVGARRRRLLLPGGGCIPSISLCYDQTNMKTWRNSDECIDFLSHMGDKEFNAVDIAFMLLTDGSSSGDTTTSVPDTTTSGDTTTITDAIASEQFVSDASYDNGLESADAQAADVSVMEFEESVALWVAILLLSVFGGLLLIGGMIVSHVTKSDNVVYGAVFIFVVHSIDVFSDVFFCISIWTDHALVDEVENKEALMVLAICSVMFIVMPMCKNFYDLIQFQRETQDDPLHGDRYRAWLNSFGTTLLMLALISGSTFGTMKLMNSNLLGLRMFSMGLCISHLRDYHSYRMVNVVLCENLPQLIIQIAFTSILKKGESVPVISLLAALTSILSIIVAVVDHFSKKELTKQAVPAELFTFQITSNEISAHASKYRNRQKKVIKGISKILAPLDKSAIEILTCSEYSDQLGDGLIVYFLITTCKYKGDEMHKKLKDSINNGAMQRNMIKAWNLNPRDVPTINHLRLLQIEQVSENEVIEGNATTTNGADTTSSAAVVNNNAAQAIANGTASNSSKSQMLKKKLVVKASDSMQFTDLNVDNYDGSSDRDEAVAVIISPMIKISEANDENDANQAQKDKNDENDAMEYVDIELQNIPSKSNCD